MTFTGVDSSVQYHYPELVVTAGERGRIVVRDLSIDYGRNPILREISFSIEPRTVTVLLGASGCGKTTLLYCLNRLTDLMDDVKVRGHVRVSGLEINDPGANVVELRRRVGMVLQCPTPFRMSIRKNIELPLREQGIRSASELAARVRLALSVTGLWDEVEHRLDDSAARLSIGQQQRLCIARALTLEPDVLLMDEPCSSLDPGSAERIETLIRDLRDRCTVILVTHDWAQARRVADSIGVLRRDKQGTAIAEFGTPSQVFEALRSDAPPRGLTEPREVTTLALQRSSS